MRYKTLQRKLPAAVQYKNVQQPNGQQQLLSLPKLLDAEIPGRSDPCLTLNPFPGEYKIRFTKIPADMDNKMVQRNPALHIKVGLNLPPAANRHMDQHVPVVEHRINPVAKAVKNNTLRLGV